MVLISSKGTLTLSLAFPNPFRNELILKQEMTGYDLVHLQNILVLVWTFFFSILRTVCTCFLILLKKVGLGVTRFKST